MHGSPVGFIMLICDSCSTSEESKGNNTQGAVESTRRLHGRAGGGGQGALERGEVEREGSREQGEEKGPGFRFDSQSARDGRLGR
eukprot:242117-Hanusia_phi.AAC.1